VNCTGVYSDVIRKIDNPNSKSLMLASGGTHIMLP